MDLYNLVLSDQRSVRIRRHLLFWLAWTIYIAVTYLIPTNWIPAWNPLFGTPGHPDFPSGHSQNGGAFAAVMTALLGDDYHFTIHTYDNLGMAPRSYDSFDDLAVDVGKSRVYAGIHYTYSCVEGKKQGEKIAENIMNMLQLKKE